VRSFGEEEREKSVLEFTKGSYVAASEVGNVDGVSSWLLEGLADGAFYDLGVAFCKGSI